MTGASRPLVYVVVTIALSSATSHGAADDVEEAAALFDRAEQARAEHRIAEARDLLERSLALDPAAPTAFNLAVLTAEMSRITAAIDLFDDLLAERFGPLEEGQRAEIERRLDAARAALVTVRITGRGPETAEIRIDGEPAGRLAERASLELRVDPGRRVVIAAFDDGRAIEQVLDAGRGEQQELTFSLAAPILERPRARQAPIPEPEGGGVFASSTFWVVLGTVAVLAGASVGIYVATREPDRVVDPVLGDVATLSLP